MKSDVEAVYCEFKYSGLAAGLIAMACVATLAIEWMTPFPLPVRIAVSPWIVLCALEAIERIARRRGARACCVLFVRLSGEVSVQGDRGAWRSGALRDGSFVAPWLTIVRWRPAAARFDRTVLILPGMLDAETFRRLRVLLRWR
jgi:hypothetical protein